MVGWMDLLDWFAMQMVEPPTITWMTTSGTTPRRAARTGSLGHCEDGVLLFPFLFFSSNKKKKKKKKVRSTEYCNMMISGHGHIIPNQTNPTDRPTDNFVTLFNVLFVCVCPVEMSRRERERGKPTSSSPSSPSSSLHIPKGKLPSWTGTGRSVGCPAVCGRYKNRRVVAMP